MVNSPAKRQQGSFRQSVNYKRVNSQASPPTSPTRTTTTPAPTTTGQSSSDSEDLDGRSELEKQLFELVQNRQSENVQNFLNVNRNFNINAKDEEGLSVLHHAVKNGDKETVKILLQDGINIDISDALLQAVKDNSVTIVLKMWKWKTAMKLQGINMAAIFSKKQNEGSQDDITPLLMAAVNGHYELIEFLYNQGERLDQLHLPSCSCEECGPSSTDLKKSNKRIYLLKGLTNPSYLAFMAGVDKTFDPILEAFKRVDDIRRCIDEEPEFKSEYEEIKENVKQFPVDLLNMCRNTEESELLLKTKAGYTCSVSTPYPRLILAMTYRQKAFVAHANAQDVLYQQWIGEPWIVTTQFEKITKLVVKILAFLTFPFFSIGLCFGLCCLQNIKIVKYLTSPKARCVSNVVSYLVFFTVLFYMNSGEKPSKYLGPPPYYLPWVVGIFVLSHFLSFLKHLFLSTEHFMSQGWNMFELVNYVFFFVTFILWGFVSHRVGHNGGSVIAKNGGNEYIQDRKALKSSDMLLLSEITTGIASTMAGLRLLKFVILDKTLGPMQIALGKMIKDIATFILFFLCIVISFAFGVYHLYRPYQHLATSPCTFCEFSSALEAMFWSLFMMNPADTSDVPVAKDEYKDEESGKMIPFTNHHIFTEIVGKIIFVVYHVLCVTFLLNMLTGVMSNTYRKIVENVAVEWKFGRSKLWLYYIQDNTLTAPFNLIPTCLLCCNLIDFIKAVISKKGGKRPICNFAQCCHTEDDESDEAKKERDRKYPILMRRLLQRYFRSKSTSASKDPPVAEDIKQVQKLVAELREWATMGLELHSNPNSRTKIV